MTIYSIALNNLKRRKVKALFLAVGLAVGVATVVALFSIVQAMRLELGDRIDEFGANVVIIPRSEGIELTYGGTHVSGIAFDIQQLTTEDLDRIQTIQDRDSINIISPKLVGAVSAGGQRALLVGVDTRREFTMKRWFTLKEQAGLSAGQAPGNLALLEIPEDQVVLGSAAARSLGLKAGDPVLAGGRQFSVFGVLNDLGAQEDGLIFANLSAAQELLGRPGKFSMIEISAYCNSCPVEEIVAQLNEAIPVGKATALRQAALRREETIDSFSAFGLVLSGVVLAVAALVVLTTMLSSVNERAREIGIFRAVGFRRAHVAAIIVLEAALVSIPAGLFGFLAGMLLARLAGPYLAQMQVSVPWQGDLLIPAVALSAALAASAAAYPALKAARLDPVEALRFI
jgi:putative ABC transport system permease protein